MKTCEQYEEMISAFIDGILAEEDRKELMAHMTDCPVCQAYFDDQIAIHDALMDAAEQESVQVPAGFAASVMDQMRFIPQERPKKKASIRWQQWTALAACCAVAAAGLWTFYRETAKDTLSRMKPEDDAVVSEEGDTAAAFPETARAMPEHGGAGAESADTGGMTEQSASPAKNYTLETEPAELAPQMDSADEGKAFQYVLQGNGALASQPSAASSKAEDQPEAVQRPYQRIIWTSGAAAEAWVQEQLGLTWTVGGHYELSAEEYISLLNALAEAGEDFLEQPGPGDGEGFLLIAESGAETE